MRDDLVERGIGDAEAWREKLQDSHPLEPELTVSRDGVQETIDILEELVCEIVQLRIEADR
jgi:hypothetical protein